MKKVSGNYSTAEHGDDVCSSLNEITLDPCLMQFGEWGLNMGSRPQRTTSVTLPNTSGVIRFNAKSTMLKSGEQKYRMMIVNCGNDNSNTDAIKPQRNKWLTNV